MNNTTNHACKMPLLSGASVTEKRAELKTYFNKTWDLYESLFSLINSDEAYFQRPEPLRHPLIFYYGHTATFYINKMMLGKFINTRINQHIESICAVGVDEMSWDDLNTEHYDWPTVDEVRAYRNEVKALINQMIDDMPLELPIKPDSLAWVFLMGIEHERIHVETSSVIMRMMSLEYLTPNPTWAACPYVGDAPTNQLLPVTGGTIELGKPKDDDTYGWDNEFGHKKVEVNPFNASKYLVSNQEFMEFVQSGGYQNLSYWNEEGQNWLSFSKATMPRFWFKKDGQYYQRNLLENIKLPLNWPVEINYLEAKAFCNFKAEQTGSFIRLPTEPEWFCLRNKLDTNLPHWPEAPGNINLEYFASSCPVDKFDCEGFYDITGNVWQWTESPFDGFNGFKVHPLYDDFSTPTFDGKHNLIKGGSWISTGNEAQKHSRYAFRRHFFQHAGFRYVQSDRQEIPIEAVNVFEENPQVAKQLELHYGDLTNSQMEAPTLAINATDNYLAECVKTTLEKIDTSGIERVLDLGCSVGRSSFELALHFNHVDGIDFTARNIQHAFMLQEQGEARYTLEHQGEIMDFKDINISEHAFWGVKDKINFSQGDPCNIKPIYDNYDLVFCANLLESLNHPELFFSTIVSRINAGGYLVLSSNYDWGQDSKQDSQWLGGVKVNGENFLSINGLKQLLEDKFTLVAEQDIHSIVTKSARRFDVDINQLTIWKLK